MFSRIEMLFFQVGFICVVVVMLVRLCNYLFTPVLEENIRPDPKPVPPAMPPRSRSDCKLSRRACELPACRTTEGNLIPCSACQAVYYCGAPRLSTANSSDTLTASHQAADRERHRKGCNDLEKAREAYAKEEQALGVFRMWNNESLFEVDVGNFWDIGYTPDSMHARHHIVDTMLEAFGGPGGREETVEEALGHLLDMLRLSSADGMGVRDTVPGLYIRLGKDQAAYDFMKWYAINNQEDWSDDTLPYLDIKNADAFEDPLDIWTIGSSISSAHVGAVLLIKVRILLDLRAAQNATRAFSGTNTIPAEIIDLIRSHLVSSGSIVKSRPDILLRTVEDLANLIQRVKRQVRLLYESINRYNPCFWYLIQDEPSAEAEGALVALGHALKRDNLASWVESPGAFEVIRALGADF